MIVVIYPLLRKWKINFSPVMKMTLGFLMVSVSMVYASVLQHYIYVSAPNSIHVWIQAPAYVLVAFSEAFVIITGLELAFTKAPQTLRSLVSALFWLTIGVAAAICIALAPVSQALYLCFRNSFDDLAVITGRETADMELDVSGVAVHGGKLAIEEGRWQK
jgi:POT family proton-dependent oligopeptide transporter